MPVLRFLQVESDRRRTGFDLGSGIAPLAEGRRRHNEGRGWVVVVVGRWVRQTMDTSLSGTPLCEDITGRRHTSLLITALYGSGTKEREMCEERAAVEM